MEYSILSFGRVKILLNGEWVNVQLNICYLEYDWGGEIIRHTAMSQWKGLYIPAKWLYTDKKSTETGEVN